MIKLRKISIFFLLLVFSVQSIKADSYIVYSNDNHQVIEEKNSHEVQSVASISKIMTALVAIEQGELNEIITVSSKAPQQIGSSLYLVEGQQVTLVSLLYGLMLRSGNDAAYEIAVNVAGSVEDFVALMNQKAEEIGMKDSTFVNPSGLDEEDGGNLSSCYDMALCMSEAMKYPIFNQIVSTKYYDHEVGGKWKNKNKLLFDYPFVNGGKTGYTKNAGKTLVSSANNGYGESIVVSFRNDEYFKFHEDKHTEYFNDYRSLSIIDKGIYHIRGKVIEVSEPLCFVSKLENVNEISVKTIFTKDGLKLVVSNQVETQTYELPYQSKSMRWFS